MASRIWPIFAAANFAAALFLVQGEPGRTDPAPGDAVQGDPVLGDPGAKADGRAIYRSRCYFCHRSNGSRGPDLFASRLSDAEFRETVIGGRRTMPAFGTILTQDEVRAVQDYVRSTDHYE